MFGDVVQHEAASRFDRAAEPHLDPPGRGVGRDAKLFQKIAKVDLGQRAVEDQAHRALVGMRADQHDRPFKARIGHARHGDQDLAGQVGMVRAARRGAAGPVAVNVGTAHLFSFPSKIGFGGSCCKACAEL